MSQERYLSVTALTKYLKRKFDADPYLERVFLTGEISNYRLRANAHQYFSLKDDGAKISAVMFKGAFQKLKFQLEEGMKVLAIGRVSLYEPSGSYQLYVEHMEPDGIGALYQALEKMKQKLSQEGLFQSEHKQAIPAFPKRIAVVTSPSGAVIRDIITTIKRRFPIVELVVFPTVVQGDKAAADIVKSIERVERAGNFDTMIIARGGGSIEDLWPFNEEIVARAIYQADTPVISSVGHETDITISDLVADVRAATPTAAAELSVPVLTEELYKIRQQEARLLQTMSYLLKKDRQRLQHSLDSYVFKHPGRLYEGFSMRLDLLKQRLQQAVYQTVQTRQAQFAKQQNRLLLQNPKDRVQRSREQLERVSERLLTSVATYQDRRRRELADAVSALDLLSPLKTMARGYSYTVSDGRIIKSVDDVAEGQQLTTNLQDGYLESTVSKIHKKAE
ncbi:exodeoxyribonuclease VII large subunit [Vagococcus acidifermentans]|uniref:Exodeoxyribonuclease 7 large subunit n=1 Tax=Vagococcus acidifermentans TaxID=564710 RepID=A0A430AWM2_9ENTE|nr:exodeoxyribonuclease VII large subunit [Vagococcus acidifermentans]RSU12462.1 exodeoxyribonuclease VII large subunit [Vagococcus acidifermentans]